jgi:hypothetical protein
VLPDFVVIEDKAPDAVAATTATVFPVPEDELSAEDLAALAAIEQAYANRQQQVHHKRAASAEPVDEAETTNEEAPPNILTPDKPEQYVGHDGAETAAVAATVAADTAVTAQHGSSSKKQKRKDN